MAKTLFPSNLCKNRILYGCIDIRYGQNKYTIQKYNLDIGLSFYYVLKSIYDFFFFFFLGGGEGGHIWSDTPAY